MKIVANIHIFPSIIIKIACAYTTAIIEIEVFKEIEFLVVRKIIAEIKTGPFNI